MPETKTTEISVEKNAEGDVVLTLPATVWADGESDLHGAIRLFLTDKQMEDLGKEAAAYELATLIEKAEKLLSKLPRESIRRDLGRVGVKALRRYQSARKSKEAMEQALEHAADVLGSWLDKTPFGSK